MNEHEDDQRRIVGHSSNCLKVDEIDDDLLYLVKKELDNVNEEELKEMTGNLELDQHSSEVLRARIRTLKCHVTEKPKMASLADMQKFTHNRVVR